MAAAGGATDRGHPTLAAPLTAGAGPEHRRPGCCRMLDSLTPLMLLAGFGLEAVLGLAILALRGIGNAPYNTMTFFIVVNCLVGAVAAWLAVRKAQPRALRFLIMVSVLDLTWSAFMLFAHESPAAAGAREKILFFILVMMLCLAVPLVCVSLRAMSTYRVYGGDAFDSDDDPFDSIAMGDGEDDDEHWYQLVLLVLLISSAISLPTGSTTTATKTACRPRLRTRWWKTPGARRSRFWAGGQNSQTLRSKR